MRNFIFILVFMIIFISCKAASTDNDKIKSTKIGMDSISNIHKNELFIGIWNLSKMITTKIEYKNGSSIETESATVCNVCPTIIFKKDGEGILSNADGKETLFKWTLCNDKIYFSFDRKSDEDSFFSLDKVFNLKTYSDSKNSYIELSEYSKKYKYILIGNLNQNTSH